MKYLFFTLPVLLLLAGCNQGEVVDVRNRETLDRILASEFQRLNMPGLGFASVRGDSVVYMDAMGYANVLEQKPFTPQTRMVIASVSKTFIATAVMQLWEQGKIGLDTDISRYLPFVVRNPHFPNDSITVRMLMTHTSSITDAAYRSDVFYLFGYTDYPESIGSFLTNYLTPEGAYHDPMLYSEHKPGTEFSYSNVASTLLAYLVERVSGTDFNTYCKNHIFQPLKMTRTAWFFSETPQNEVAIHYTSATDRNPTHPYLTYPDYPDGHLITTVEDLSRFLRAYLNRGTFDGTQLLAPATVRLMLSQQADLDHKQGLIFAAGTIGGREVWGHNGGDPGTSTEMYFDTLANTGVLYFCNQTLTYSPVTLAALLQHANP